MRTVEDLMEGFSQNVRAGIPTTLDHRNGKVYLNATDRQGQVGICDNPCYDKVTVTRCTVAGEDQSVCRYTDGKGGCRAPDFTPCKLLNAR